MRQKEKLMFRKLSAVILIVGMLCVIGCTMHMHEVGDGAQGNDIIRSRQWYVLWGLVPINDVNTHVMAGGATDYTIMTEVNLIDALINAVLVEVSIHCRTVTVYK